MKLCLLIGLVVFGLAALQEATYLGAIDQFWRQYADDIQILYFYDSAHIDPTGKSFERLTQQPTRSSDVNNASKDVSMIKIDLGNKELKEAQEIYAIPSVPYIEVYQNGKLLFEQIPDYKTDDQIWAIAEK